jgi:hypothetical protein
MSFIYTGILCNTYYNNTVHRSTYSWWGAFLGSKNKQIFVPDKNNFYLSNWIVIE